MKSREDAFAREDDSTDNSVPMVQKGNKVMKKIMNCKFCMLLLFCSKKEWFEYENVCFCILKMIF